MKYPKKSLGQNFLIDNNIIKKIISTNIVEKQNIIEIGPGTGSLTKIILKHKPKSLILIEKDIEIYNLLKKNLLGKKNVTLFNNDILDFDLEKKIRKNSIIFGNLPYNISSQILVKLLKFKNWPPKYTKMVLMFQKEVAQKILADFNTHDYGRFTIISNFRLKVINSFNVSRHCFFPKPKVESTVLVFEPIERKDYKIKDISNLEKVTHIFFSNKRKMINKSFKKLFKNFYNIAEQIKIDLSLRPSQLNIDKYYKITEIYELLKK